MAKVGISPELDEILNDLAEEIDVPSSKYEDAITRYTAVSQWLNESNTVLAPYSPMIYPQGSFALGTAIKPDGDDDYDVDVVCRLDISKKNISQQHLKEMIGNRLKENKNYAKMLDPKDGGRRCWTLKYADESKFHLDILPAIPDDYQWLVDRGVPLHFAQHALCITDKETWNVSPDWPRSNPKGYLEWFKLQMKTTMEQRRRVIAQQIKADVQQVPDYKVRTPLQKAIQILKRHRDMRYNGNADKPISIIITTLAGRAYNNEPELSETLRNILPKMRASIQNRGGVLWVPNPVNPAENFADKWGENPKKRDIFFEWLDSLDNFHQQILNEQSMDKVGGLLSEGYGEKWGKQAFDRYTRRVSETKRAIVSTGLSTSETRLPSRFNVPHRKSPLWPITSRYGVRISAYASRDGFRTMNFGSDSHPLPKNASLRFEASTDTPTPFDTYWQVVNTGAEAVAVGGLRGHFSLGGLIQKETTLYRGTHWIECFIVKNDTCVARSGEFVVNIQ